MENNNAIATQGPDDEAKIEDVKPTVDGDSPEKVNNRQRRRPYRKEIRPEDETGKWAIRRKIWDHLEDNNLVNAPRPCHYRIPNFEGAAAANDRLTGLAAWKQARTVKVNPDKPQEQARFLVLEDEKELVLLNQTQRNLLVPTPQLRTGLLNRVVPPADADKEKLRRCCTSQGVKENSKEIGLEDKVKIDLIIVGSVAVSRKDRRQRQRFRTNPDAIVWMGGLSSRLRVSALKSELRNLNLIPARLVWRGPRGFAYLHFHTTDTAKEAVDTLFGREFEGREAKVEMANNDRPRRRGGDYRRDRGNNRESQSEQQETGDR
ncbi:methenyltetrahydrofolate synthase domain-containing protein [Elysia marginata]|uniref:Methenyltetrahydrofolate synthase domain-containing protein n=1 Tax=Elysia marginata TaxID=1093978 RepID=A0AAV4FB37_9GAST|nr:methenyltetrahydrofolate synthase domain-containing protein [Elysia marginata]